MANTLKKKDWDLLLRRIKDGKCTPFLGAGACADALPLGYEVARKWSEQYHYPLENSSDLVRVAQFLAVEQDPMYPKEEILKYFNEKLKRNGVPDFNQADEPHGLLADLMLPVYMTTNYDDFMFEALKNRRRDPRQELCRWNKSVRNERSIFEAEPDFEPTPANPIIFHLHGHNKKAESLVLTEDDYLDFLVNISNDQDLLPPRIQQALTDASLLFIGYSLTDWNFRVLFRGLVTSTESSLRRLSITVQLPPVPASAPKKTQQKAQKYLDEYFSKIDMRVYWGTAKDFTKELRKRAKLSGIIK